ncbi:MAG: electron transfer flavoprotein subunit alpha/FixB family protein, partial [Actinomycetota bacterium]|nr:electron transfer flavoprotein subunit alpha/FixB family protein [Actinomycetota bacterium]
MGNDVLVLAEHRNGRLSDVTFELVGKARELADRGGGRVLAVLLGETSLAHELGVADVVLCSEDPAVATYNAQAYERAMVHVVERQQPRLVLTSTTTVGMDVSTALSVHWPAPLASYVVDVRRDGEDLAVTCRAYGGKLLAEVALTGPRAICAVIAG